MFLMYSFSEQALNFKYTCRGNTYIAQNVNYFCVNTRDNHSFEVLFAVSHLWHQENFI